MDTEIKSKHSMQKSSASVESHDSNELPFDDRAVRILKDTFGLSEFRPGQMDAIAAIFANQDTFVIMPTGGGKSLIYQLPAVLKETGLTLVISPLIALMKDQTEALKALGIDAEFCNSTQDELEQMRIISRAVTGKIRLLYVSPERAMSSDFLSVLPRMNLNCIAVDEAHCISQWGHDFRPEYRKLSVLRGRAGVKGIPLVALTATATERVIQDSALALGLKDWALVKKSFYRPNLHYSVEFPENEAEKKILLLNLLKKENFNDPKKGKCIIYCATRKKVDFLFDFLNDSGFKAGRYHAGRSSAGREKSHNSYSAGKTNILVATNAFGMGMDYPDVRMVLHYQVPPSLEAYYQESGRAGRDDLDSNCVLFFHNSDFVVQSFIIGKEKSKKHAGGSLLELVRRYGMSDGCRQKSLCAYFGEEISPCGKCDQCRPGAGASRRGLFLENESKKIKDRVAKASYEFSNEDIEAVHGVLKEFPGKFGKKILAGILRGSRARNILKYKLNKSPYFASLKSIPEEAIIRFFEEGVQKKEMKIAGVKYPKIYLANSINR